MFEEKAFKKAFENLADLIVYKLNNRRISTENCDKLG